jgi:hypothetical protein
LGLNGLLLALNCLILLPNGDLLTFKRITHGCARTRTSKATYDEPGTWVARLVTHNSAKPRAKHSAGSCSNCGGLSRLRAPRKKCGNTNAGDY